MRKINISVMHQLRAHHEHECGESRMFCGCDSPGSVLAVTFQSSVSHLCLSLHVISRLYNLADLRHPSCHPSQDVVPANYIFVHVMCHPAAAIRLHPGEAPYRRPTSLSFAGTISPNSSITTNLAQTFGPSRPAIQTICLV